MYTFYYKNRIFHSAPVVAEAPPVPFAGCSAAMKCVPEEMCDMQGVMVNKPMILTDLQKKFRTPMMVCYSHSFISNFLKK